MFNLYKVNLISNKFCFPFPVTERFYAVVTEAARKKLIKETIPVISCKRKEFNLYKGDSVREVKFGTLPLASSGWRHRKSKNDFFIIHSTAVTAKTDSPETQVSFQLDDIFMRNLKDEMEISELTPIQISAISKILDMNHVLLAAETGCGKTLAYLLPIVEQIRKRKERNLGHREFNTPMALILTPGRELASQIGVIAEKTCVGTEIKVKTIIGGNTKQQMLNPEFNDIDILVGTIGAISKLVTTGIYRMNEVRHVVLDEADTMLDDSFSDKLCYFLKKFPFHRNHLLDLSDNILGTQLILASATMPTNISELLSQIIDVETIEEVVSPNLHKLLTNIKHKFIRMNKSDRPGNLLELVKSELRKNRALIVFANKSSSSDFVSMYLNDRGVNCINFNGDMLMKIRAGRFEQYQNGKFDVLSTTDVGSRGLDTTRAQHIINFDFPLHVADYIHRCGRIGRVGSHENCLVTNFVSSQREIDIVQKIEHAARTTGLLPDVNGNITGLIGKNIMKGLKEEGLEV